MLKLSCNKFTAPVEVDAMATVGARMTTPEERRRLSLFEGTPVITVTRVAFDVEGHPVEMTDTVKSAPSYVLDVLVPRDVTI